MHYSDILAKFSDLFPNYKDQICQWAPKEKNRIRVKLHSGQSLDFIYYSDTMWTLSTVNTKNRRN